MVIFDHRRHPVDQAEGAKEDIGFAKPFRLVTTVEMGMGALLLPLRFFPDDPAEAMGRVRPDSRANHLPFIINHKGGHAARPGIGPAQALCLWETGHPEPPDS